MNVHLAVTNHNQSLPPLHPLSLGTPLNQHLPSHPSTNYLAIFTPDGPRHKTPQVTPTLHNHYILWSLQPDGFRRLDQHGKIFTSWSIALALRAAAKVDCHCLVFCPILLISLLNGHHLAEHLQWVARGNIIFNTA